MSHLRTGRRAAREGAARANGTPTFFVTGIFLNGDQPAVGFEKIINEVRAAMGRGSRAQ